MDGTKRTDELPPSYSQLFSEPSSHGSSAARHAGDGHCSPVTRQHQQRAPYSQGQEQQLFDQRDVSYAQSVAIVGQPQRVVRRPMVAVIRAPEQEFTGHLVFAVFTCLCCGGCLGLIALVLAGELPILGARALKHFNETRTFEPESNSPAVV